MKIVHPRLTTGLFVLLLALFAFAFALQKIHDPDLWWHLRSGAWICEHLAIPVTDIFSFATAGEPWINTSWLAGPLLYLLHQLGGAELLVLFQALVVAGAFGGACLLLIRSGVNPALAALVLGYAVVVTRFRFLMRPEIFVFPGIVLLYGCLRQTPLRLRTLALLAAGVTLWANLHGTAYLAPAFACCLLLEAALQKGPGQFGPDRAALRMAVAAVLLLSLAVLLTPFGLAAPAFVLERALLTDLVAQALPVEEHKALAWNEHRAFWLLLGATGLSLAANIRRARLFDLLLFGGLALLAVGSVRYVGLAALIFALLLGQTLQALLERTERWRRWSAHAGAMSAAAVALAVAGFLAWQSSFGPSRVYQWGLGVHEGRFPLGAVAQLRDCDFSGNIFNTWDDGGYLLWALPEARTVFDGRALDGHIRLRGRLLAGSAREFHAFLREHAVEAVLLSKKDGIFVGFMGGLPGYELRYFDEKHLLYLSAASPCRMSGSPTLRFRFIQPGSYDYAYLAPLATGPEAPAVEEELRVALSQSPANFFAAFQLAFFLEQQGRVEALAYYLQAMRNNPALGFSHFDLGQRAGSFALQQKAYDQAITLLETAAQYGKTDITHQFLLATAYYQSKNLAAAEALFGKILAREPRQADTLMNLGFLYLDSERPLKAESSFRAATDAAPRLEGAWYGLALARERLGRADALETWEAFLARFPQSRWAEKAREHRAGLGRGTD